MFTFYQKGEEMKITSFEIDSFEKAKNERKWKLGNEILYKMCQDHPLHTDLEEIRAKIWLIGRSYAAAIERRKNKKNINDNFYDDFVEAFVKFNKEFNLDSKLIALKNKELSETTINEILKIHNELTRFFYTQTKLDKRSLASKYLHFHVPIFPIYDSRAKDSINKIVSGKIDSSNLIGDKEYSKFCYKLIFLINSIKKETGYTPTAREVDTYLIMVANKKLHEKQERIKKERKQIN